MKRAVINSKYSLNVPRSPYSDLLDSVNDAIDYISVKTVDGSMRGKDIEIYEALLNLKTIMTGSNGRRK